MKFVETPLKGAYVIEPKLIGDERGFFSRTFCQETFLGHGIDFKPLQANHAGSTEAGTLRGLHFQRGDYAEDKLFKCIKGSIYDVIVDMRPESDTYMHWFGTTLSEENKHMLLCPKGFAHGYLTLESNSEVYYLVTAPYSPDSESGIRWNDPKINITWPGGINFTLSEKDKNWPFL